ncbi:unnamed protein product [Prunus armeniaca]|uniref:Uncharacterized protein n=1 Tax=Prunus armeniaca TaxID=36596 RepID=A0A6J5WLD0_PRUAR|nr:unnamed protein product [Prunus armeniaca]
MVLCSSGNFHQSSGIYPSYQQIMVSSVPSLTKSSSRVDMWKLRLDDSDEQVVGCIFNEAHLDGTPLKLAWANLIDCKTSLEEQRRPDNFRIIIGPVQWKIKGNAICFCKIAINFYEKLKEYFAGHCP